ncbi:tryptophan 2,3-dioxygenase family protein [bacterium]|nr:tryptophan 2,3-dioxygenase family protein [bacterium]
MDYGNSPLTYGDYLKVPELLKLQQCLSDPASHDELQFIIVHQAYELWFKLLLFELDSIMKAMKEGNAKNAVWLFQRVIAIERLLNQQIHILETMSPVDFLRFRSKLNPASGFQSVQFREIEFISNLKEPTMLDRLRSDPESLARLQKRLNEPTLWDAFLELLQRNGFEIPADRDSTKLKQQLVSIYENPEQHYELFLLAEAMIEHDELIGLWRVHHVRMVERMIGNKIGTGGSEGVRYLTTTLMKKCFPELWDMRTMLGEEPEPQK